MTTMRYAAQSFLDGFTSMSSIFFPALRPGSEEPLFLSDAPSEPRALVDRNIMAEVESFLHEVEPLIIKDQTVHRESQVLLTKIQQSRLTKIQQSRHILSTSQSGT